VQLYTRAAAPKVPMPVKQLRGFERVQLGPGEQRRVTFRLNPAEDFSYYSTADTAFKVEPGPYEVQAGASSRDIRLTAKVTVR
jgi:beta-glucosidase